MKTAQYHLYWVNQIRGIERENKIYWGKHVQYVVHLVWHRLWNILNHFSSFRWTAITFGNWYFLLTNHQWKEAIRKSKKSKMYHKDINIFVIQRRSMWQVGDRAAENPSDRHSPIVGIVRKKVLLSPQKCCMCSKSTLPFNWIYFWTFYILFVFEFVFVSILLTRYNAAFFLCIFGIVQ